MLYNLLPYWNKAQRYFVRIRWRRNHFCELKSHPTCCIGSLEDAIRSFMKDFEYELQNTRERLNKVSFIVITQCQALHINNLITPVMCILTPNNTGNINSLFHCNQNCPPSYRWCEIDCANKYLTRGRHVILLFITLLERGKGSNVWGRA